MALNNTQAEPNGIAVCDTLSLTSYTINRTRVSPDRPSEARKLAVQKKLGLLLF